MLRDTPEPVPFYLLRARGRNLRLVSVLESTLGQPSGSRRSHERGAPSRSRPPLEWTAMWRPSKAGRCGPRAHHCGSRGTVESRRRSCPWCSKDRPLVSHGVAFQIRDAPALDGTLDGFELGEPLQLDHEDQYRRSEEPYAGPEEFSATATVNWNDEALFLAVDVVKPEVVARDPQAPPLRLDNEPDEIHGDGIQVYLSLPER